MNVQVNIEMKVNELKLIHLSRIYLSQGFYECDLKELNHSIKHIEQNKENRNVKATVNTEGSQSGSVPLSNIATINANGICYQPKW